MQFWSCKCRRDFFQKSFSMVSSCTSPPLCCFACVCVCDHVTLCKW